MQDSVTTSRCPSITNLLFANWINYYVYQETPYDINEIR